MIVIKTIINILIYMAPIRCFIVIYQTITFSGMLQSKESLFARCASCFEICWNQTLMELIQIKIVAIFIHLEHLHIESEGGPVVYFILLQCD